MKKILCLILALIIFMPVAALADDGRWMLISQDKNMSISFDKQSINKGSRDTVYIIWFKFQYDKNYARETVSRYDFNKERYKDFSYDVRQYEFDIDNRRMRVLSYIDYDTTGKVIASSDNLAQDWTSPAPDTIGELMYNVVTVYCQAYYETINNRGQQTSIDVVAAQTIAMPAYTVTIPAGYTVLDYDSMMKALNNSSFREILPEHQKEIWEAWVGVMEAGKENYVCAVSQDDKHTITIMFDPTGGGLDVSKIPDGEEADFLSGMKDIAKEELKNAQTPDERISLEMRIKSDYSIIKINGKKALLAKQSPNTIDQGIVCMVILVDGNRSFLITDVRKTDNPQYEAAFQQIIKTFSPKQ